MKLFVYGELCKPAVLMAQLGRIPPMVPAILDGYRRQRNPDTGYYEAGGQEGARITGLLIESLDSDDFERLDKFENVAGGEYRRIEVEVAVVDKTSRREVAFVYVAGRLPDSPGERRSGGARRAGR